MNAFYFLFLPIICLCTSVIVISSEHREDSAEKTLKFVDDAQKKLKLANNSNIILVIGNTGTGKSTLVHYLTGDLRKLTSIAPDAHHTDYTVQDDLDISQGRTKSMTESKTLIPEMIEDEEHLLWYDCPGFGDTRNTTVEIANAFLIKNLIESASRAKLVLVTDYASVTTSRDDFDLLLNRTTQLVKNIDHFYDSVSLIVTKVPPLKFRSRLIVEMFEDGIKAETVQFIKGHREYLLLNSLGSVHKIQLMNALFASESQNYPQISVFWRPDDSGTFDKLPKLVNARATIRTSVKQSQYSKITPGDFGYALTADGKLYAGQVVNLVHKDMIEMTENLVNQVKSETEEKINSAKLYKEKFKFIHNGQNTFLNSTSELMTPQYLTKSLRSLVSELRLSIQTEQFDNIERRERNGIILKSIIDSDDNETMSRRECETFIEQIKTFFEKWNQKIESELEKELSETKMNISNNLIVISEEVSQLLQSKLQSIEIISTKVHLMVKIKESIAKFDTSLTLTNFVENFANLINTSELSSFDHSKIDQVRNNAKYLLGDLSSNEKFQFDIPMKEWIQKVSKINDTVTSHSEQLLESATEDISNLMSLSVKQLTDEINLKITLSDSYKMKREFINNGRMALPTGNHGSITLVYLTDRFAELADKLKLPQNVSHNFDIVQNRTQDIHLLNVFMRRNDNEAIPPSECVNILNQIVALFERWNVGIQTDMNSKANVAIANISNTLTSISDEVSRELKLKLESIEDTPKKLDLMETIKLLIGTFDTSTTLTNIVEKLLSIINEFEITSIDQSQVINLRNDAEYLFGDLSSNEIVSAGIPNDEWIRKVSNINGFITSYAEQMLKTAMENISTSIPKAVDQLIDEIDQKFNATTSYKMKRDFMQIGRTILPNRIPVSITMKFLINKIDELIKKMQLSQNVSLICENIKNRTQDSHLFNAFMERDDIEALSPNETAIYFNEIATVFDRWDSTIQTDMLSEAKATIVYISTSLTTIRREVDSSVKMHKKLQSITDLRTKVLFLQKINKSIGTVDLSMDLTDIVTKLSKFVNDSDLKLVDQKKMVKVRNDVAYLMGDLSSKEKILFCIPMDEWIGKVSSIKDDVLHSVDQGLREAVRAASKYVNVDPSVLVDVINLLTQDSTILTDLHTHYVTVIDALNKNSTTGKTPLQFAVALNMLDVVEFLLQEGVFIDTTDNRGWTPLHVAADKGFSNLTKYLIENGAQINKKTKDNQTALHIAVSRGNAKFVEFQIMNGAMHILNDKNARGKTALDIATEKNNTAVVEILKKADILENVKRCLQDGADLNARDGNGDDALHLAAYSGDLDVMKYLIEIKGMDVNGKDNVGETALHEASKNGRLNVIKCLIEEKGMDVRAKDNNGETALHWASKNDQLDAVKYFVGMKNIDVNSKDKDGYAALHLASYNGHLNVVKYLIDINANINVKTNSGYSPADMAINSDQTGVAKWLKNRGGQSFQYPYTFSSL